MTNTKPFHIYQALTRAVDDYCDRHYIGRGAFALRVGFNGPNAENQLSNHLNPRSQKNISHEREYMIMCELDDMARHVYFKLRGKEWGLDTQTTSKPTTINIDMSFHTLADDAMIEGDEAFSAVKKGLKDGLLTKKELKAIRKESIEAVRHYEKMVELADVKLRGM
jgi:hypothetical protein